MIYELLYIIPSKYSDSEVDGVIEEVKKSLEKNEAKIEKTEILGKIKLAYPINKERHGTYVLSYMDVAGEKLAKIEMDLKLMDQVLRHIFVKREAGIPKESFTIDAYEAPITPEGKRIHQKPRAQAPVKKRPVAQEKISEQELDKKIDSILEDSDLSDV